MSMSESRPNAETLAAMKETEDILSGRIVTKSYTSIRELLDDLEAEADDENDSTSSAVTPPPSRLPPA